MAANKPKSWDHAYHAKKKLHLLDFKSPAAAATAAINNKAVITSDAATANAAITDGLSICAGIATAVDPWSVNADTSCARHQRA